LALAATTEAITRTSYVPLGFCTNTHSTVLRLSNAPPATENPLLNTLPLNTVPVASSVTSRSRSFTSAGLAPAAPAASVQARVMRIGRAVSTGAMLIWNSCPAVVKACF
jgi:hypothetical protein